MMSNYKIAKIINAKPCFKLCALVLFTLFYYSSTVFAINLNTTSVKGMSQAYGFVLGQEYSLSRIAKEYPELTSDVELARAQFGSSFPDIKTKLEAQLKQAMGEKLFQEAALNIKTKLRQNLGQQQITREIAVNFLAQVSGRSKGKIESPVIEYLLAVKYTTNPVGEFSDGYRQRYKTDGAGKSQGITLNLQLPKSWAAKEGDRPHIVKKWVSENGTGLESILLEIHDMDGDSPTKKEVEKFVGTGEVKETVPEGSMYIASGNFTIEMQPGYWVQMGMPIERAGVKFYQDILIYQFFFRGKTVGIICQAGGLENDKLKTNEAFKRVRPLCQQVLNSLVLTQAY